jgi:hypothetical protein
MFKQPTPGGGKYIKLDEFEGNLVLFRPTSVDQVPAYKAPEKLVDEVTADWTAFGPTGEDTTFGAKFKGAGMVRAAKEALRDPEHPYVLGVLEKVPTNETRDKLKIEQTPEAYKAAREKWLRTGAKDSDKPGFAWTLSQFSDEQAAQAAAYIERTQRQGDPFKAATPE